jgi:hypothetical protein
MKKNKEGGRMEARKQKYMKSNNKKQQSDKGWWYKTLIRHLERISH